MKERYVCVCVCVCVFLFQARHICKRRGASLLLAEYHFPSNAHDLSGEEFTQQLLKFVNDTLTSSSVKLAVFDHITSNTAIVLPIKPLIQLWYVAMGGSQDSILIILNFRLVNKKAFSH